MRERRRRFLGTSGSSKRRRRLGGHLRFEPLEARLLLAGDLDAGWQPGLHEADVAASMIESSQSETSAATLIRSSNLPVAQGEGPASSLVAEGEAAPDLVAFAKALANAGVKFYGAFWCPLCNEQKQLFQDGAKFLPYIEASTPDRQLNEVGIANDIEVFPTWDIPGQERMTGVLTLAQLSQLSGVAIPESSTPSFVVVANKTALSESDGVDVQFGSPLHLAVDAYDPNGNPLTITVSSADPNIVAASVTSGSNRSLKMEVQGFGDMVFELFEDKAPIATARLIQLAQDGFYDAANNNPDIGFHRVINNFVIQWGDPTGTGAGGSSLGDFKDNYHIDLQHNRTGGLSYAKGSDDTNDTQLFVVEGQQRNLDFNHSIVGQLVEGEAVREAISNVHTVSIDLNGDGTIDENDQFDVPSPLIPIKSVSVFNDTENGAVLLKPVAESGETDVTITVTDTEGLSVSQTIRVRVVADTSNSAPFLNAVAPVTTVVNAPTTIHLTATDVEGDDVFFDAAKIGTVDYTVSPNNVTGDIVVTPPTGFVGTFNVLVGVRAEVPADTVDQFDTEEVAVTVKPLAPTSVDLLAASDTGSSSSDNVTKPGNLQFQVNGVTSGALVTLRRGTTVLGQATASGDSVTISTSNLNSLGDGAHSVTAIQTLNGVQSDASPALQVTLDGTAPTGFTSTPPTTVALGQTLTHDVHHSEERTAGFRFSLANAPEEASITDTTGVVTWAPGANDLGENVFQVVATDLAGNTATQEFSINVTGSALVNFRLETTNLSGTPISSVRVGDEFLLRVFVSDARGFQGQGVFSAYLDVHATNGLIAPAGATPITHATNYSTSATGVFPSDGVIDELGGAAASLTPLGPDEALLAEVRYRAVAAGTEIFDGEPADVFPASDTLLFGTTTPVPTAQILYGSATIAIELGFGANDDVFNVDEDSLNRELDVLNNDVPQSGQSLTISGISAQPTHGTLSIAPGNLKLRYTPNANFNGEDTFTYTVSDGQGGTDSATAIVQVHPINDPPVAINDTETVQQGSTNNFFDVLSNDSILPDAGETLRVTAFGTPSRGGTVQIGSSGSHVLYSPAFGFTGDETFTYTVTDSNGGTAQATVAVTVVGSNSPPTVVNESFTVQEDALQAEFDVLANDSTTEQGETLTIKSVGTPSNGGAASVSTSRLRLNYRPAANFHGTETVTYVVDDSRGGVATGTVTFTVNSVNDPPTASDDSLSALKGTAPSVLRVLDNDSFAPDTNESLTITNVTSTTAGGTLSISADKKSISYTPPNGSFEGTDTFSYTIADGNGGTDTAAVTVRVLNYVPRDIGGSFTASAANGGTSDSMLGGVSLVLTGEDAFGNSVQSTTTSNAVGVFRFTDVAPGNYRVSRSSLTFLNDTGSEFSIESAQNDGDSVDHNQDIPGRQPQYITIRDFLGSTPRSSILAAVEMGGGAEWFQVIGSGWDGVTDLMLSLSDDGKTLVIDATRNGASMRATVDATHYRSVETLGTLGDMRLIRIRGGFSNLGFQSVSSTSATTPQGEGNGLVASGEASVAIETAANRAADGSTNDEPTTSVDAGATDVVASSASAAGLFAPSAAAVVSESFVSPVVPATPFPSVTSLTQSPLALFTGSYFGRQIRSASLLGDAGQDFSAPSSARLTSSSVDAVMSNEAQLDDAIASPESVAGDLISPSADDEAHRESLDELFANDPESLASGPVTTNDEPLPVANRR